VAGVVGLEASALVEHIRVDLVVPVILLEYHTGVDLAVSTGDQTIAR
jgi:hypothetical protein